MTNQVTIHNVSFKPCYGWGDTWVIYINDKKTEHVLKYNKSILTLYKDYQGRKVQYENAVMRIASNTKELTFNNTMAFYHYLKDLTK